MNLLYNIRKTEEHYNFIKKYFTFNTELHKFLISSSKVVCVYDNDTLIGLSTYVIKENNLHIYYIMVDKDYRNQGWARTILSAIINNNLIVNSYTCNIRENNIGSINLFKSFGFKQIGTEQYEDGTLKLKFKK